jgi:NADH-quinone oxidoreductase subunit L
VFLVARMYPVYQASGAALNEIAVIGSITMLIAALLALVQDDIKRVLAYSTVSQLAYMMAGLGVGGYGAGIFHLFTHAFFKALLFLAAGSVIHAVHTNNMSEMGGLRRAMPWTFGTFLVGALALAGFPLIGGFWSKDEILTDAYNAGFGQRAAGLATSPAAARLVFVVGMVTAFLTAVYVARMLWLTFFVAYRGHGEPHESDWGMLAPLVVLAVGTVAAGFAGSPLVHDNVGRWISTTAVTVEPAHANLGLIALASAIAVVGLAAGGALYRRGLPEREYLARVPALYTLLEHKYFLDDLYEGVLVRAVTGMLAPATYWFDQRAVDGAVNGAGLGTRTLARGLRHVQSGQVQWYAAVLFVGVVALAVIVTSAVR